MGPFENQTNLMSSWYADENCFINNELPWFIRGGNHNVGLGAGVFTSNIGFGSVYANLGYRIVLVI